LRPGADYASLRPVSELKKVRKWLKDKYLKQYFKFPQVFHNPVENPVENFHRKPLNGDQEGAFTTSSAFSLKEELEQSKVKVCIIL
jgi:hypothetical protein